jgi:calcineurin-like phosphoesterase family protein
MNWWLTADTHFCHSNIIRYCNRPFANVNVMDDAMMTNWNAVVKPDDHVIHCGDFAFAKDAGVIERLANRLNGHIHLILGNHDKKIDKGFASVRLYHKFRISDDIRIFACHYSMLTWDCAHHGVFHAFGHSHNSLPVNPNLRSMDVGVDGNNFAPVHLDAFLAVMATRKFTPIDHHEES